MKKFICFILLIFILCGCSDSSMKSSEAEVMVITSESVYQEIDNKNIYIIDVRENYEYDSGHIKNAYNVPLTKIEEISKMMISLDSKIIVYCHSGKRSRKAAELLIKMGYTNVYDMGGIEHWDYDLIIE